MTATVDRPIFVYTITAGLGDLVVLGTVARWINKTLPGGDCFLIHRNNPHIHLWQQELLLRCVNVYSPVEMFRFVMQMRQMRRDGRISFGLQMAPGSFQGFLFLRVLHKLGAMDYVVDFNLVNADIITPPRGGYILNLHLNQILDLVKGVTAHTPQRTELPFKVSRRERTPDEKLRVGLHPWSRRGHQQAFVWQEAKWLNLIRYLGEHPAVSQIIIFGKDERFEQFQEVVSRDAELSKVRFYASRSVLDLTETIGMVDLLVTVNTGVVHIAYALDLPMIILNGPSLELWVPIGEKIISVRDKQALFAAPDRARADERFSRVNNIELKDVIEAVETVFARIFHAGNKG